jgi:hypothetical protein
VLSTQLLIVADRQIPNAYLLKTHVTTVSGPDSRQHCLKIVRVFANPYYQAVMSYCCHAQRLRLHATCYKAVAVLPQTRASSAVAVQNSSAASHTARPDITDHAAQSAAAMTTLQTTMQRKLPPQ